MQKSALILVVLLALALSSACLSDTTITVPLDPPKEEAKSDLELKHETLGATRTESQKTYSAQTTSANRAKKEVAVGRVGIVTASKAAIRSYPSSRGRVYFTCPKDTYIAVLGQYGNWYGVLMIDSSTGWVEKSKISLLDYEVMGQTGKTGAGSGIVQTALKYLGIPYVWGGYSFGGLDCSGFVKAVFASHGIGLPRVARDQAMTGTAVGWTELQPGDRLYFACKGGAIDHAGIYMGNGLFVHSSVSRGGVAVDQITKPFYMNSLVAVRRS